MSLTKKLIMRVGCTNFYYFCQAYRLYQLLSCYATSIGMFVCFLGVSNDMEKLWFSSIWATIRKLGLHLILESFILTKVTQFLFRKHLKLHKVSHFRVSLFVNQWICANTIFEIFLCVPSCELCILQRRLVREAVYHLESNTIHGVKICIQLLFHLMFCDHLSHL